MLFVFNGKEQKVVNALNAMYKGHNIFPFLPLKDKWFVGKGKERKGEELLFSGYVFIDIERQSTSSLARKNERQANPLVFIKRNIYYCEITCFRHPF
ncbi:MAG: hypothetical protein LBE09_04305 [Christensenellaceae bacterium]|nr:hypothetical protein [Christensenellaceae bacterium]